MNGETFSDHRIDGINLHGSPEQRVICPRCSADRHKSGKRDLAVNVYKGTWLCHHCGWSGGLSKERQEPHTWKPIKTRSSDPTVRMFEWFERRGIPREVVVRNRIRRDVRTFDGQELSCMVFGYWVDGQLVGEKYRGPEKHQMQQSTGGVGCFYGIDDIAGATECLICEGEIDKVSLETAGYLNTVSVPNGAPPPNAKNTDRFFAFLEHCRGYLDDKERIILATDADAPGMKLREELARRLGKGRCRVVTFPEGCKDANDVLVKHGAAALRRVIETSQPYPIEGVHRVRDYADLLRNIHQFGIERGSKFRISTRFDELFTVYPGQLTIVTGDSGHGKALALDTPIPTPQGWSTMGEIQRGDTLFDEQGNLCTVIAATDVMLDRPCYEVTFDDGTKIVADEGHLWFTSTKVARISESRQRRIRNGREETAPHGNDQRFKRAMPGVVTTGQIAKTLLWRERESNHHVPLPAAIQCPTAQLPIPPYTLGAWLGDGATAAAQITSLDREILDAIEADGFTVRMQRTKIQYGILGLQTLLRATGLRGNKHIPAVYQRASVAQRLELLRGLMDTDGTVMKDGTCEIVTILPQLADDIRELVAGLGIKVRRTYCDRATLNGKDCGPRYRICFTTREQVFRLLRKAERLPIGKRQFGAFRKIVSCLPVESVPVRCIRVDSPSSLFLVSRSFIPTHNSNLLDDGLINLAVHEDWKVAFFTPEHQPEHHQMRLVEILIGRPFLPGYMNQLSKADLEAAIEFCDAHFRYILPGDETYRLDSVLEASNYLVQSEGTNAIVLDPWNAFEHQTEGQTETNYIAKTLNQVRRFARNTGQHVFIVAHPRKPQVMQGKTYNLTLSDICGSIHFRNITDNGLIVTREWDRDAAGKQLDTSHNTVTVAKVKHKFIGKLGKAELDFEVANQRFRAKGTLPNYESRLKYLEEIPFGDPPPQYQHPRVPAPHELVGLASDPEPF